MSAYNPRNERLKREYLRFQKEAGRKADSTLDGIRKAIGRFEEYTGRKDFATFNKEQAVGFKKYLTRHRGARTGEPMAKSTLVATVGNVKEFFRWLSWQSGFRSKVRPTDIEYLNLSENETRAAKAPRFKTYPTIEQIRAVNSRHAHSNGSWTEKSSPHCHGHSNGRPRQRAGDAATETRGRRAKAGHAGPDRGCGPSGASGLIPSSFLSEMTSKQLSSTGSSP